MTALDHIRRIISRHRYRQSLPNPHLDDLGDLFWPAEVGCPSGRSVVFDSIMISDINELSESLERDNRTVRMNEWQTQVRESVAHALDACSSSVSLEVAVETVYSFVNRALEEFKQRAIGCYEFPFGCNLFDEANHRSFCIGPVRFEARHNWLDRKHSEGAVSDAVRERIRNAWNKQHPNENSPTRGLWGEEAIIRLGAESPFVCSVVTDGMTHEFSQLIAKRVAQMALTSVAMLFQNTSRILRKLDLVEDGVVQILPVLSFCDRDVYSCGARRSHASGGILLDEGEWKEIQRKRSGHFSVVGDVLSSISKVNETPARPRIVNALTHGLCGLIKPVEMILILLRLSSLHRCWILYL